MKLFIAFPFVIHVFPQILCIASAGSTILQSNGGEDIGYGGVCGVHIHELE